MIVKWFLVCPRYVIDIMVALQEGRLIFANQSSAFKVLIFKTSFILICYQCRTSITNQHFGEQKRFFNNSQRLLYERESLNLLVGLWIINNVPIYCYYLFLSISLTVRTSQARNIAIEDALVAKVYKDFFTHTTSIVRAPKPICSNLWRCFRYRSKRYCRKVSECTTQCSKSICVKRIFFFTKITDLLRDRNSFKLLLNAILLIVFGMIHHIFYYFYFQFSVFISKMQIGKFSI